MSENESAEKFQVKVTGAGLTVERETTRDIALRVVSLIMGSMEANASADAHGGSVARPLSPPIPVPGAHAQGHQTAKQFLAEKKPNTDAQKAACLAYFLRHSRGVNHFKTGDIVTLNSDAQQLDFSNATTTLNNGLRDGLFSKAGDGAKQITAKGEAVVEALPDGVRAKEAMHSRKKKAAQQ